MLCPLVLLSNFIDDCGNLMSGADLTKLISSEELFKLLQNIRIPITGLPERVILGVVGFQNNYIHTVAISPLDEQVIEDVTL